MIAINSAESAIKALTSDDAGVRYHAAWWLGKNRVESAVNVLIQCLQDDGEQTSTGGYPLRRQAARSLGLINDSSCTPYLLETLETNDTQLHEATLRALIALKDADCIDALNRYIDKNIEGKPIEALIEALTTYKVWACSEKIKPYLSSESARIASAAASYFYSYTSETCYLNAIHAYLRHDNRFIRQSAAFDLARIASMDSTESILNAKIPNNIKMHCLKSILGKSILFSSKNSHEALHNLNIDQEAIIQKLDNLVRENFAGNIVIEKDKSPKDISKTSPPIENAFNLSDSFNLLKSPSLSDRELGIQLLATNHHSIDSGLSKLYFSESDQDIKIGLIKAIAATEDSRSLAALIDAIGVDIGNHCQGNIRRVATCALGKIGSQKHAEKDVLQSILTKLAWAATKPDDWGLRYSACLALEEINNNQSSECLSIAQTSESDPVVWLRIHSALARTLKS